jgi:hypothetical protein
MREFFLIGGFSMFPVLFCGLAALLVALYATGRPSAPVIALADRLARAELFFSISGVLANVAVTLRTVASVEHEGEDGFARMLATGLYESQSPAIMGLAFLALAHLALAIASFRLAKREP